MWLLPKMWKGMKIFKGVQLFSLQNKRYLWSWKFSQVPKKGLRVVKDKLRNIKISKRVFEQSLIQIRQLPIECDNGHSQTGDGERFLWSRCRSKQGDYLIGYSLRSFFVWESLLAVWDWLLLNFIVSPIGGIDSGRGLGCLLGYQSIRVSSV